MADFGHFSAVWAFQVWKEWLQEQHPGGLTVGNVPKEGRHRHTHRGLEKRIGNVNGGVEDSFCFLIFLFYSKDQDAERGT